MKNKFFTCELVHIANIVPAVQMSRALRKAGFYMITQENKKIAVDCLKEVLALIHEKRYKELNTVVDEIHYDKLDEVLDFIEESIYPYVIDGFDPEVEYYLYEMSDNQGFGLDYPLTSCGTKISGILFMVFEYTDNGLVKIIHTVDAD